MKNVEQFLVWTVVITRNPTFVSEDLYVNSNGFVFDYHTGLTYTLNPAGVFVFKQLLNGDKPSEITRKLKRKYGISHRVATSDLDDLLQQLSSLNLLKFKEA